MSTEPTFDIDAAQQLCDHDSHYMEEDDGHFHWRCLRCGSVTECESCAGEPS